MLGKLIFSVAIILVLVGGTSHAKEICGENTNICIQQDGKTHWFNLRFRGSAITHFNVRYTRKDGREMQREIGTADRNTAVANLADIEKGRTTIHVQACYRKNFGPISSRSGCTAWLNLTVTIG